MHGRRIPVPSRPPGPATAAGAPGPIAGDYDAERCAGPEDIGEVDAAPQVFRGGPGQAGGPLRVIARSPGRVG